MNQHQEISPLSTATDHHDLETAPADAQVRFRKRVIRPPAQLRLPASYGVNGTSQPSPTSPRANSSSTVKPYDKSNSRRPRSPKKRSSVGGVSSASSKRASLTGKRNAPRLELSQETGANRTSTSQTSCRESDKDFPQNNDNGDGPATGLDPF